MLSVRGEEANKVQALDAGADDYVTKPFGIEELLARVRASLRRVPAESEQNSLIETGDFRIDLAAHKVTVRSGEVRLTPKEFDLLVYLARHAGKVVTHRALLAIGVVRAPSRWNTCAYLSDNCARSWNRKPLPTIHYHRALGRISLRTGVNQEYLLNGYDCRFRTLS